MLFSIFIDNFWNWRTNDRSMRRVDSSRFKEFKLIFVIDKWKITWIKERE